MVVKAMARYVVCLKNFMFEVGADHVFTVTNIMKLHV